MDVLTDKQYKTYTRLSRYSTFPIYYNKLTDKYVSGTTGYLSTDTQYSLHVVQEHETYDSIALKYYNNPTYFWVICNFNRIQNAFEKPQVGMELKIPVLSSIEFFI